MSAPLYNITSAITPVALRIRKPGRGDGCPIVGKITTFNGDPEPVLMVTWRHQQGTATTISVPLVALDYAEAQGCRWLYWVRDQHPKEMRRISLADLRWTGWLQPDGEIYVPLDKLEPALWRRWRYATEEVYLEGGAGVAATPDVQSQQLTLWGGD